MSFRREIVDSYEAAYYLMHGATVASVRTRSVGHHRRDRLGFRTMWIVTMENIPEPAVRLWREGTASGSLRSFADARKKLKKKVREFLEAKSY